MMNSWTEHRGSPRHMFETSEVGAIYGFRESVSYDSANHDSHFSLFVNVQDISQGGAKVSVDKAIELPVNSLANFIFIDSSNNQWQAAQVRVAWTQKGPHRNFYIAGLQFVYMLPREAGIRHAASRTYWPQPSDIEFLLNTSIVQSLPRQAICPLLNCLSLKKIGPGNRVISQGEIGDTLYLIQEGICTVSVEKDGTDYTIDRLHEGDVVGEIAVLTDEPRIASVDTTTEVKLWELNRKHFETISDKHPDLRDFLTEILTYRLENTKQTANRTIGKYLIEHKIGSGGYSIVYQGIHQTLNLPVAIKMLKHTLALKEEFWEKFKKEAKIIASLNHENIVKVYDIEEVYRTVFIIMEYFEGESIERMLERMGAIPIPMAVGFIIQTCSGLQYAHERGLVHLDIKPANLFVETRDQVKILDFGLARPPEVEEGSIFEGTIQYLSPEQISCESVDCRTDIYSLGITAFEMVVGRRPYPEDNQAELLKMHVNQNIPDPATFVPALPDRMREFIIKSCQRDPDKRYQKLGEALDDLEGLAKVYGKNEKQRHYKTRNMTNLNLFYSDKEKMALNKLLQEFISRAQRIGVDIKAAEFKDI